MLQLSLIGGAAAPAAPSARRRLQLRVHRALESHLTLLGLDWHEIETTAELVVDALVGDPHCSVCGFRVADGSGIGAPKPAHRACAASRTSRLVARVRALLAQLSKATSGTS